MKNILLFISIFLFQISFSQVITFECNNEIIVVSFDEIANDVNAYTDWNGDGVVDEIDYVIYLEQLYDCQDVNDWGDDEVDDCAGTWIADITTGNCADFTSEGSDVCNSYSGCEWTSYWNSITYSDSNNCVGSYEIDNGYCEALVLNITELLERKSLIKTIDILGRETTNKGFQLHIYDDGSVEKKYLIK